MPVPTSLNLIVTSPSMRRLTPPRSRSASIRRRAWLKRFDWELPRAAWRSPACDPRKRGSLRNGYALDCCAEFKSVEIRMVSAKSRGKAPRTQTNHLTIWAHTIGPALPGKARRPATATPSANNRWCGLLATRLRIGKRRRWPQPNSRRLLAFPAVQHRLERDARPGASAFAERQEESCAFCAAALRAPSSPSTSRLMPRAAAIRPRGKARSCTRCWPVSAASASVLSRSISASANSPRSRRRAPRSF